MKAKLSAFVLLTFGVALGLALGRFGTKRDEPAGGRSHPADASATFPRFRALPLLRTTAEEAIVPPLDGVTLEGLEASMKAALLQTSNRGREDAFRKIVESIDPTNFHAVLNLLAKSPQPILRHALASRVLERWARTDAKAALAYAEALPVSPNRTSALQTIVNEWALTDPGRAAQWVGELGPGPQQNELVQTLVNAMAGQDPQAALSFVESLQPCSSARALQQTILRQWALRDPAAAASIAEARRVSEPGLLASIAGSWARQDPTSAIEWVKHLPQNANHPEVLRELSDALAYADPKLATEFALSLPPGNAQNSAVGAVASQWLRPISMRQSGGSKDCPRAPPRPMPFSGRRSSGRKSIPRALRSMS